MFLKELKFEIKKRTYLHYKNLNEAYVTKFIDVDETLINLEYLNLQFTKFAEQYSCSLTKQLKSLVNRSLEFAFNKGLIKTNMQVNVKIKTKNEKQINCLTKAEQECLEQYILDGKKQYYYGFLISLYTGLRLGELLALKWTDVDFENRISKVNSTISKCVENHKVIIIEDAPKTISSIREIPLTSTLVKIFKSLRSESVYVLCNKFGERMDYRGYQTSFARLLKKLNIKHYGIHSLRHTFATRLLENGVDIKTISELMGHSSPTVTLNRYVHTNMDNKRIALQKLNKKNNVLNAATKYFYSESEPTEEGNFWHYVDGEPTIWVSSSEDAE